MNTLTPVSINAANQVSSRPKAAAAEQQAAVETPGDQVSISDAPPADAKPGKKGLGMMGKAAAVLALAGALSGCAVTTGTMGPYGYGTSTVGVTPTGQVYTQETQVTPWGVTQQGSSVGPHGAYYYQNGVPYYWNGSGYYPRNNHHHHHGPVYVPRAPVCTPMSWWGPGTCY